jgi:hypothetical protein
MSSRPDRLVTAQRRAPVTPSGMGPAGSGEFVQPTLREAARGCPYWIVLLIISLMMPTEFSISLGSLRLSPYRIVLILGLFPAIRAFAKARGNVPADYLILLHLVWAFIVLFYYHGVGVALETGGVRFLEFGGAYLFARAYLTDFRSFLGFSAVLIYCMCLLAPIAIFESVTGIFIFKEINRALLGVPFYNTIEPRLGFARAWGPFDHPILLGTFASSAVGIGWALKSVLKTSTFGRRLQTGAVLAATATSLSAGPFASLVIQSVLIVWRRITDSMAHRWRLFTLLLVLMYIGIDLLSNRTPIRVFLTYLTFSEVSAYNRLNIFEYGSRDVTNNPMMGIGLNPWSKPEWMHSDSMDNFWLFQAVSFGFPGFLLLAIAAISLLRRSMASVDGPQGKLRLGWIFSVVGLILAGTTVHFWNSLFCYFALLLGAGAWFSHLETTADKTVAKRGPATRRS